MDLLYIVCIIVLLIFSFELFAIYYVAPTDYYENNDTSQGFVDSTIIEKEHLESPKIKPYAIVDDEII